MELKPLICPQCGGEINRARMICEYCGTTFAEENNVVKIVAYHPGVHTLGAVVDIPQEWALKNPTEAAEFAIREMAKKFAAGIAQFMDVRTMDDPVTLSVRFGGKLRVLESGYRITDSIDELTKRVEKHNAVIKRI